MLEFFKWNICVFPETGGIVIAPRPAPDDSTPKPGFPTRAFFGIDPVLVDSNVCNYIWCQVVRKVACP